MNFPVHYFCIVLLLKTVQCINQTDKLFFVQNSSEKNNTTLLVVVDKELIKEVIRLSGPAQIKTFSEDQTRSFLGSCPDFGKVRRESGNGSISNSLSKSSRVDPKERKLNDSDQNNNRSTNAVSHKTTKHQEASTTTRKPTTTDIPPTLGYDGIPIILPRTKWCGAGARATHYDELGDSEDTDKCCRAHDFCNDTMAPGETRYNLTNTSTFTKLSCKCDMDFYDCLDSVNSFTSNTVGNMFFNVLRRECYRLDYPLTNQCKTYRTFLKLSCLEYERNTSSPKIYQWIPATRYKKIPIPGPLTLELPF